MLNGTGRRGDGGEDGENCYSSGCWDFWGLMNAAAITSAAPAVHQELISTLAERSRIHRRWDQPRGRWDQPQRRWDQPQPARYGAGRRPAASHDAPNGGTELSVASLLPHTQSRSFGHAGLTAWPARWPCTLRRGRRKPGTAN
jgi:hypothetical protein